MSYFSTRRMRVKMLHGRRRVHKPRGDQIKEEIVSVALGRYIKTSTYLGTVRGVRRGSTCTQTAAEVLASSTTCEDMDEVESPKEPGFERAFTALSVDTMATFIERYPQGKLWVFDSDGHIVSDSEDDLPSNEARLEAEAAILLNHFPGACQIISLPLWDPRSTRWAVCFVYSTSKYRTLTYETEFLHCVAFSNCITIEMGRLATMASDKLKGGMCCVTNRPNIDGILTVVFRFHLEYIPRTSFTSPWHPGLCGIFARRDRHQFVSAVSGPYCGQLCKDFA